MQKGKKIDFIDLFRKIINSIKNDFIHNNVY